MHFEINKKKIVKLCNICDNPKQSGPSSLVFNVRFLLNRNLHFLSTNYKRNYDDCKRFTNASGGRFGTKQCK